MRGYFSKRLLVRYVRQREERGATADRALVIVRAYGERRSVPGVVALLGAIDGIVRPAPSPRARRYALRPAARA
jgi:hypothetical protein